MVLSLKDYLGRLGLPESISPLERSKLLEDMMSKSIGDSMVNLVVQVLGTEEMQGLHLQVSIKERVEVTS